jgi:hypothetical protein
MRNTAADRVRIKAVELEDPETGATTRVLSEKQIEVGDRKTVKVDGFERTSSSNKQDLKIIYGSGGIEDQVVEGTITGKLKAKNHVYLQHAKFNRSTNILNITAQNTGNSEADVDYAVNSDTNSFTGNLGTLSSGEAQAFMVNTDKTFPLQNVSLNVEGQHFSNSQKQLKCTPTEGLVGDWPLDNKNTYKNKAHDISGQNNDGQLNGVKTGVEGVNGEAHEFRGGESIVYEDNLVLERDGSAITWWMNPEGESSTGLFTGRNRFDNYISARKDTLRAETDTNCNGFYFDQYEKKTGWNHYAIVLNDSKAYAYENGNYLGEATSYGSIDCDSGEASKLLNDIILDSIGSSPKYNSDYIGKLDEIKIFNRSLNKNQVKRISQIQDKQWASNTCRLD